MQDTKTKAAARSESRWLLSMQEAQTELHLSKATFSRLVLSGALGSITIGRRRLIPVADMERFIAMRRDAQAAQAAQTSVESEAHRGS
jgi:excisionase family DNA binding protein